MDARDLSALGLDPAAARVVGDYLAALEAHLPAGRRTREEILTELADDLVCAVAGGTGRGRPSEEAAREAVTQFGDPTTVAAAFTRQLAPVAAHRVGLGLVATGPLVGLIWVAAFASGEHGLPAQIGSLLSAMPIYPVILAVTVPAAMLAVTGAGWAARHLPVPAHVATGAAIVAAVGCVAVDVSLVGRAIVEAAAGAGPQSMLTFAAFAASLVRLSAAGFAGRRIARLRAAAT